MILIEESQDIKKIHVVVHSTRVKILNALIKRRMFASNLLPELNIERKVITFHLNALEKAELVKSKFGLTEDKRPSAVKYYEITPKGKEIFENLFKILKKLDNG